MYRGTHTSAYGLNGASGRERRLPEQQLTAISTELGIKMKWGKICDGGISIQLSVVQSFI
jgi:hypothetical protein